MCYYAAGWKPRVSLRAILSAYRDMHSENWGIWINTNNLINFIKNLEFWIEKILSMLPSVQILTPDEVINAEYFFNNSRGGGAIYCTASEAVDEAIHGNRIKVDTVPNYAGYTGLLREKYREQIGTDTNLSIGIIATRWVESRSESRKYSVLMNFARTVRFQYQQLEWLIPQVMMGRRDLVMKITIPESLIDSEEVVDMINDIAEEEDEKKEEDDKEDEGKYTISALTDWGDQTTSSYIRKKYIASYQTLMEVKAGAQGKDVRYAKDFIDRWDKPTSNLSSENYEVWVTSDGRNSLWLSNHS